MSKAKAKSLSPKQAAVKATSLLKGIDNSITTINKHQKAIKDNADQLQTVLIGLSNPVTKVPAKKAGKAETKAKKPDPKKPEAKAKKPDPKKPETKAKKPETKAKKPDSKKPETKAKKPDSKKSTSKTPPKKAASPKTGMTEVKVKAPVPDRPTVKDAIRESIGSDGPDTKANLYHHVTNRYGYWSRQSFYNALKDKKLFREVDGKITDVSSRPVKTTDEEAQKFIDSIKQDQVVATTA